MYNIIVFWFKIETYCYQMKVIRIVYVIAYENLHADNIYTSGMWP